MPGLFASQFAYGDPYTPEGLQPGVLNVGAKLPSNTPKEKTPTEEPAPKPAPISNPSLNAANAAANQNVGVTTAKGAANQAALSNMIHATGNVAQPQHVNAPAHAPAQHASPGILGDITHAVSSGLHDIANVAQSPVVHDVMNFGSPFQSSGLIGLVKPTSATPAPAAQQGIKVNSIRLNQGSPATDVQTPQYSAIPRGWSANAVGSGNARPAIEAPKPSFDYAEYLTRPAYNAVPRGWSANGGYSGPLNSAQFDNAGSSAASDIGSAAVPRGWSAGGGWASDVGNILGDIADSIG